MTLKDGVLIMVRFFENGGHPCSALYQTFRVGLFFIYTSIMPCDCLARRVVQMNLHDPVAGRSPAPVDW